MAGVSFVSLAVSALLMIQPKILHDSWPLAESGFRNRCLPSRLYWFLVAGNNLKFGRGTKLFF
jgi:hypothetical protein